VIPAKVDDPTEAIRTLDRITTRKHVAPKRTTRAFNPLARDETQIFRALLDGQHMIRGFSNPDIRNKLKDSPHLKDITDPRRQSAKVTRIFNPCHAHGLIAKIPTLDAGASLNQVELQCLPPSSYAMSNSRSPL